MLAYICPIKAGEDEEERKTFIKSKNRRVSRLHQSFPLLVPSPGLGPAVIWSSTFYLANLITATCQAPGRLEAPRRLEFNRDRPHCRTHIAMIASVSRRLRTGRPRSI